MMNKVMGLFAFLVLLGFLGILFWHVPRIDLGLVIGATLLLAVWDMYTTHRSGDR